MSPKARNKENKGLPARWRIRHGAYYFRVPPGKESLWHGKKEFHLGTTLAQAHKTFSEHIDAPDSIFTMCDLIDRYRLEVTPNKSPSTQKGEISYLVMLRTVFDGLAVAVITPQDCYRLRDEIARKRGATTSNRVIELLSHLFTKSIEWGARPDHPIIGKVKKTKVIVKRRIPEYWEIDAALAVAPPLVRLYVELKLMTALRMTDMLSIRLADITPAGLRAMPSKTSGTTGQKLIIRFDESGALLAVLDSIKALPRPIGSAYLFCTRAGQPYIKENKSCNAFQSMWQRWQKKALKTTALGARFSEKSLRNRTASDIETVEAATALLGHASADTTRRHYRNNAVKVSPFLRRKAVP